MKTFRLVSLEILEKQDEELIHREIPLKDGLIIDQEVDHQRWLIECYISKDFKEYFEEKIKDNKEIVIQVRITKATNPKATLVVKVLNVNDIEDDINVIINGRMVNRVREQVENILQELIEAGYQGEALLSKFKEKSKENLF